MAGMYFIGRRIQFIVQDLNQSRETKRKTPYSIHKFRMLPILKQRSVVFS